MEESVRRQHGFLKGIFYSAFSIKLHYFVVREADFIIRLVFLPQACKCCVEGMWLCNLAMTITLLEINDAMSVPFDKPFFPCKI